MNHLNLLQNGLHETYKDKNNSGYILVIIKINNSEAIKKSDKSKVIIGPSGPCQNLKKMQLIWNGEFYGADSVRWFILSDSPPEKDVQWSDTGVTASNKFLKKCRFS